MIQPLFARVSGGMSATSIVANFWGGDVNISTTNFGQTVIGAACVLSNVRIGLDSAPGAGTSYTLTLQKNSVDTALAITIADATLSGVNTAAAISLAAGDKIRWRVSVSGAVASVLIRAVYAEFNTVANNTCIYPTGSLTFNSVSPRWANPLSLLMDSSAFATHRTLTMPCAGTITGLYGYAEGATNTGPGYTVVLYKNGVKQDGAGGTVDTQFLLDSTVSPFTGNASFSLPVAVGDLVYAEYTRGGSSSSRVGSLCYVFVADQSNTIPLGGFSPTLPTSTTPGWPEVIAGDVQIATPSAEVLTTILRPLVLQNLYTAIGGPPGAGESRIITFYKSQAPTNLTVTMADAAQTGNDTAHKVKYAASDTISMHAVCASSGTGAASLVFTFQYGIDSARAAGGAGGNKKGGGGAINIQSTGGAGVINYNPGIDIGITA